MLEWTGNTGTGTSSYNSYQRDHILRAEGKDAISGSSDPAFRGNAGRWNPEELLVAALAACHQLWYLHLCAAAGICVLEYADAASGEMAEDTTGGGRFLSVTLRPSVAIRGGDDRESAIRLHSEAHGRCFIANSVNFPVHCQPVIRTSET